MGMRLYTETKIVSKEEYDKFNNGEVYLDNYEGLNFVDKQEVDAEIAKLKRFFEDNIEDEEFDEKYLRLYDYWRWEQFDFEGDLSSDRKLFENDFFNNLEYFKEGHCYFTVNEWLNYEDDDESHIERTIDSRNINGQDVYCLVEAKFW